MNKPQAYGFLLINKPPGPTSHDMVDKLRKITNIKKIGHAGTLDPFARGLLIMAVGRQATREISSFVKLNKTYETTLRLGETTETHDKTGRKWEKTLDPGFVPPAEAEVKTVIREFIGRQDQLPPMFSAKKVNGQKMYELARRGKQVDRQPVPIEVLLIKQLDYKWPCLSLAITCSSGTYIRSLGYDIGVRLAGGAYLEELKRTSINGYSLRHAIELNDLNETNWKDHLFWPD